MFLSIRFRASCTAQYTYYIQYGANHRTARYLRPKKWWPQSLAGHKTGMRLTWVHQNRIESKQSHDLVCTVSGSSSSCLLSNSQGFIPKKKIQTEFERQHTFPTLDYQSLVHVRLPFDRKLRYPLISSLLRLEGVESPVAKSPAVPIITSLLYSYTVTKASGSFNLLWKSTLDLGCDENDI